MMMTWKQENVVSEVRQIVVDHLEREIDAELTLQTELVGDLGIDSLGVMEIVAELEDKFELTIADKELREVTTMGDVVNAIVSRLRDAGRLNA